MIRTRVNGQRVILVAGREGLAFPATAKQGRLKTPKRRGPASVRIQRAKTPAPDDGVGMA